MSNTKKLDIHMMDIVKATSISKELTVVSEKRQ